MALNLQDKQAIVAEVSEVAKGALSAVVADSRGVTVDKMTELRKAGREAGGQRPSACRGRSYRRTPAEPGRQTG